MSRIKEKLKAIWHVITDDEYAIYTFTVKNGVRVKGRSACLISDNSTPLFLETVIKFTQKYNINVERACKGCVHKQTTKCPQSSLCYSLTHKPHYSNTRDAAEIDLTRGWIPVEKGLPRYQDGLVIVRVANKNKEFGISLYDACYIDEETNIWGKRWHTWETITHWHPMPEFKKGE